MACRWSLCKATDRQLGRELILSNTILGPYTAGQCRLGRELILSNTILGPYTAGSGESLYFQTQSWVHIMQARELSFYLKTHIFISFKNIPHSYSVQCCGSGRITWPNQDPNLILKKL